MLSVLHSPSHTISHTGAQVIAAFGAVDVQRGGWDSLLPSLFGNVSAQDSPLTAKVSSLEVYFVFHAIVCLLKIKFS